MTRALVVSSKVKQEPSGSASIKDNILLFLDILRRGEGLLGVEVMASEVERHRRRFTRASVEAGTSAAKSSLTCEAASAWQ